MGQRAFQSSPDQPRVEGIVAVLNQDRPLGKTKEGPARVSKLGCADQHRSVDVVALLGVRVDRRSAIDKGVKKRERARQLESLGSELEHQKRCVAGRFDVDGDELRIVQHGLRAEVRRIDRDLLPRHRLGGAPRL
jgi:hypothetical protein